MFNKEDYWKNRQAGKRGQGELSNPQVVVEKPGSHVTMSGRKIIYLNRKESRQKAADHDYTKPNYKYRTHRDVAPFAGHKRNAGKNPPLILPLHRPDQANHQRMLAKGKAQRDDHVAI